MSILDTLAPSLSMSFSLTRRTWFVGGLQLQKVTFNVNRLPYGLVMHNRGKSGHLVNKPGEIISIQGWRSHLLSILFYIFSIFDIFPAHQLQQDCIVSCGCNIIDIRHKIILYIVVCVQLQTTINSRRVSTHQESKTINCSNITKIKKSLGSATKSSIISLNPWREASSFSFKSFCYENNEERAEIMKEILPNSVLTLWADNRKVFLRS